MNSTDLKNLIMAKHPLPEWATFAELRNCTGFSKKVRIIDVATFNTYPSKSKRIAYEIKIYRSDFIKELEQPEKRKWCEELFHETYFVCLPEVCKPEEVPEGWGLYYPTKNGKQLRRKIIAKHRDIPEDIPYLFTLSVIRRMCEQLDVERSKIRYIDGEEFTTDQLEKHMDNICHYMYETVEVQSKKLSSQIKEAVEAKEKYVGPLRTLNKIVNGQYAWFDENGITSEQVIEWAEKVKSTSFLNMKHRLVDANRSIHNLLENIKQLEVKEDAQNTK